MTKVASYLTIPKILESFATWVSVENPYSEVNLKYMNRNEITLKSCPIHPLKEKEYS